MAWALGGVQIFVQDLKEEVSQIIPRLQPLSGGTVLQTFGYESDIETVAGLVVGATDKDALKAMSEGSLGDFLIKNVRVNRVMSICQTLRPDLPEDSPVYAVEIQLYV